MKLLYLGCGHNGLAWDEDRCYGHGQSATPAMTTTAAGTSDRTQAKPAEDWDPTKTSRND